MEIGTVEQVDIVGRMKESYLDYAMSVITARALPDVRDGLKPVQRRILFAMQDMGIRHDRPYKKSARIVGEVLGKYHPHGDSSVYEAMVRLAQSFSMRYMLVDGQGNFGSVDGDAAAAMRYTEARLAAIAEEILLDIDKNTVDFTDNFDGSLKEPTVLPSRVPNLLLNGASGIAVGMATNIPPHNLSEVCDAIVYLIENFDRVDDVTVEDLMKFVPGPDFPTGGIILGKDEIKAAYATGKGQLVVRSKIHTEDLKGGRSRIVITELPYQVNKAALIERIADLVRNHKIESIADLRDESDRQGMRVCIELKRGEDPRPTIAQLFKDTAMQSTFGVNLLAIVDRTPRLLPLKRALQFFIEHRQEVITRRTQFDLDRAKQRAHILEGLKIALDYLDAVIETIRRSQTAETALQNLMRRFRLSELQARAILDMQLRRLAALERKKIEDEYVEVIKQIAYLEDLLASPRKILLLIREDMREIKRAYGDARRTHIVEDVIGGLKDEDLVPDAEVLIALTQRGHITRLPLSECRGKSPANLGLEMGVRDAVSFLLPANTKNTLWFFTDQGKLFQDQTHRLLGLDRQVKGQPLSSLIALGEKEHVTALLAVNGSREGLFLLLATKQGRIKRLSVEELAQIPASGLPVIALDEGDELIAAQLGDGKQEVMLLTRQGQAIRFKEEDVRPMGRTAAGVWAIKMADDDAVVTLLQPRLGAELLLVTERGYAKRSALEEFPVQGRYGGGVRALDSTKLGDTGPVVAAQIADAQDEAVVITASGATLCVRAAEAPLLERSTWGAIVRAKKRLVEVKADDAVTSMAALPAASEPAQPEPSAEPEEKPKPSPTRQSVAQKTASARSGVAKKTLASKTLAGKSVAKPEPKSKPVAKPAAEPATKSESKSKPVAKPAAEPAAKSESKSKPVAKPAVKPVTKPAPKPKSASATATSAATEAKPSAKTRATQAAATKKEDTKASQATQLPLAKTPARRKMG
jgi:DNA gyrase subunit A